MWDGESEVGGHGNDQLNSIMLPNGLHHFYDVE